MSNFNLSSTQNSFGPDGQAQSNGVSSLATDDQLEAGVQGQQRTAANLLFSVLSQEAGQEEQHVAVILPRVNNQNVCNSRRTCCIVFAIIILIMAILVVFYLLRNLF